MVFDDLFTTVSSIAREEEPPSHWNDLCLEQTELVPINIPAPLSPEWLAEDNNTVQGIDNRGAVCTNLVRDDLNTSSSSQPSTVEHLFLPNPASAPSLSQSEEALDALPESEGVLPTSQRVRPNSEGVTQPTQAPVTVVPPMDTQGLRRSNRHNKGKCTSARYINEVFLSIVDQIDSLDKYHNTLLYQAALETDVDSFESEITDPRVYNTKFNNKPVERLKCRGL